MRRTHQYEIGAISEKNEIYDGEGNKMNSVYSIETIVLRFIHILKMPFLFYSLAPIFSIDGGWRDRGG